MVCRVSFSRVETPIVSVGGFVSVGEFCGGALAFAVAGDCADVIVSDVAPALVLVVETCACWLAKFWLLR